MDCRRARPPSPSPKRPRHGACSLAFDPTLRPPDLAEAPRRVVVVMRHGDRTPIHPKLGQLDLGHLSGAWQALLPDEEQRCAMDRVPVRRPEGADGTNMYSAFAGEGPYGQLTGLGAEQCRAVGRELARRYPRAVVRATSTDFPRTVDSARSVLAGFQATAGAAPGAAPSVAVRRPEEEVLLPNFNGACARYEKLLQARRAAVDKGMGELREDLAQRLAPLLGDGPLGALKCPNHFKPLCVHAGAVGPVAGVDFDLVRHIDRYYGQRYARIYEDPELARFACGRLLWQIAEYLEGAQLSPPHPEVWVLVAHDSTLLPLMAALGVARGEWPKYAAAVVLETAARGGERGQGEGPGAGGLQVRVLVDDEVRCDWRGWGAFRESLRPAEMTEEEYRALSRDGGLSSPVETGT